MNEVIAIMSRDNSLSIFAGEKEAVLEFDNKRTRVDFCEKSILQGIDKVARDLRKVRDIRVKIKNASFSNTRQIVAVVNALAWQLGVKVNGKNQIRAVYDKEPNISV